MKCSRFTEEQVIAILRQQEAGSTTAEVCCKHGVSSATFYKWKATYGCMDVSQARKLKVLEDEKGSLKRLLADAMLDNAVLKEVAAKTGEASRSAQGGRAYSAGLCDQRASGLCLLGVDRTVRWHRTPHSQMPNPRRARLDRRTDRPQRRGDRHQPLR